MIELFKNLHEASVCLYLLKKNRRSDFIAFRLPNSIDEELKAKYCLNFEQLVEGRSFGTYDFLHSEKNVLVEIETDKIALWDKIQESIKKANIDGVFLQKDNFNDDYSIVVVDFSNPSNGDVEHTFFVSKYIKTNTWIKKGIVFR